MIYEVPVGPGRWAIGPGRQSNGFALFVCLFSLRLRYRTFHLHYIHSLTLQASSFAESLSMHVQINTRLCHASVTVRVSTFLFHPSVITPRTLSSDSSCVRFMGYFLPWAMMVKFSSSVPCL